MSSLKLYRHTADSEWRKRKGELLVRKKRVEESPTCMQNWGVATWKIKKHNLQWFTSSMRRDVAKVKRLSAAVASKPGPRLLNLRTSHTSNALVKRCGLPKGMMENFERNFSEVLWVSQKFLLILFWGKIELGIHVHVLILIPFLFLFWHGKFLWINQHTEMR